MKTVKLIYYESTLTKRKDSESTNLTFKGHWGNDSGMPEVELKIKKCSDGQSKDILTDLNILAPGESLFIAQGENPQRRLDDFLGGYVRRRTPNIEDFKAEIADFDEEMLRERYESLYKEIKAMIDENKEETKKFDALFDCFNHIYEEAFDGQAYEKEAFVANVRGFDTAESDLDTDEWETPDEEE